MKKKVVAALLAAQMVVTLCPTSSVFATTFDDTAAVQEVETVDDSQELYGAETPTPESDFTWDGNKITKYNGASANVVLPSRTTAIGDSAFKNCTGLKSVTIPDKVTSIGRYAFQGCTGITSIVIPSRVDTIGYGAFIDCTELSNFEIKSSVLQHTGQYGDGNIFTGCKNLKTVKLTGKMKYIPDTMFDGADYLESIVIPSSVTSIKDKSFRGCKSLKQVSIPKSVTSIGEYAFKDCTALQSISLPENLTTIGNWTFSGCSVLNNLVIPSRVKSIGCYAFSGCTSLSNLEIKSGILENTGYYGDGYLFNDCIKLKTVSLTGDLKSIPGDMFEGAEYLETLKIPSTVTTISKSAFSGCTSLQQITIPEAVTSIEENAFRNCSSLTSLVIPSKVESIGYYAFGHCDNLCDVEIKSDNLKNIGIYGSTSIFGDCISLEKVRMTGKLESIPSSMFRDSQYIQSVELPSTIKEISSSAFENCSSLNQITIPENVTAIGRDAFNGCKSLEEITIPVNVETLGNGAFANCTLLENVTVQNPDMNFHKEYYESDYNHFGNDDFVNIIGYGDSTAKTFADENGIGFTESENAEVKFNGASITLADTIGLNFYVKMTVADVKNSKAYMKFQLADGTVKKVSINDTKQYSEDKNTRVFTCTMPAAEMSDTIKAQLIIPEADGTEKLSDTITYSVKKYCQHILNNSDSYDANTIAVIKKILNYGSYSQQYFSYNMANLANDMLEDKEKTLTKQADLMKASSTFHANNVNGIKYFGKSLILRSKTDMRIYFELTDSTKKISDYTFKCDGKVLKPVQNGSKYYVDIADITPAEYGKIFTVTVSGKNFVSSSVYDYCRSAVSSSTTDGKLKNLSVSMYELGTTVQ